MLIISHQLLSLVGRSAFLPGDNLNIGVCPDPSSLCEGSGSETKQPLSSLYHKLYKKKTKLGRSLGMRLLNNGSFLKSTSTACLLTLGNTRHASLLLTGHPLHPQGKEHPHCSPWTQAL